jgi:hypothetical protein
MPDQLVAVSIDRRGDRPDEILLLLAERLGEADEFVHDEQVLHIEAHEENHAEARELITTNLDAVADDWREYLTVMVPPGS